MSQTALKKPAALPTITVERVPTLDGTSELVLREPIIFQPELTPDGEMYVARYEPLSVVSMRYEYEELEPAILDQIAYMWESYVCTPDEEQSQGAIEKKQRIRAHFI